MPNDYTYETKCRRCGSITEWFVGSAEQFTNASFMKYAHEKVMHPELSNCKECGRMTVQDPVAFNYPDNKEETKNT